MIESGQTKISVTLEIVRMFFHSSSERVEKNDASSEMYVCSYEKRGVEATVPSIRLTSEDEGLTHVDHESYCSTRKVVNC